MKSSILLCEAAAPHEDGTLTLLRAFLSEFTATGTSPIIVKGSVVIRVLYDKKDLGEHRLQVRIVDDASKFVVDLGEETEKVDRPGRYSAIVNFSGPVEQPGRYSIELVIDGKVTSRTGFNAIRLDSPPSETAK